MNHTKCLVLLPNIRLGWTRLKIIIKDKRSSLFVSHNQSQKTRVYEPHKMSSLTPKYKTRLDQAENNYQGQMI